MKLNEMEDIGLFRTVESEKQFMERFCELSDPVEERDYFGAIGLLGGAFIRISMIESIVQVSSIYLKVIGGNGKTRPEFVGLNRIRTASGEVFYAVSINKEIKDFDLRGR